ncbi:tetratricopeptide repeat protein, partial [Kineococcus glutinatus]|uniref:tetratricopeptide repeat protein n=1 Tax=Kineococcus glutinatus TaxID=1070872 RepID=UPI003CD092F8
CGVAAAGARSAGDLARARELLERGLALIAGPGTADPVVEGYLGNLLAEVCLFEGRLDEAEAIVHRIRALRPPVPDARIASALLPLIALYRGDADGAEARARELLARAERDDLEVLRPWAVYVTGEVLLDRDPARAAGHLREALAAARGNGDRYLVGVALTTAASLHTRHGDPGEAVPLFEEAVRHWHELGNWTHQWTTLRNVADLLLHLGRAEAAAVLHGAFAAREATVPSFGADAERVRAATGTLRAALGEEGFGELGDRGGRLADGEVVAAALGFLADARPGPAVVDLREPARHRT